MLSIKYKIISVKQNDNHDYEYDDDDDDNSACVKLCSAAAKNIMQHILRDTQHKILCFARQLLLLLLKLACFIFYVVAGSGANGQTEPAQ